MESELNLSLLISFTIFYSRRMRIDNQRVFIIILEQHIV